MKILDAQGNEVLNPDLEKGYLKEDKLIIHHDEQAETPEQSHFETLHEYPNGGKEVERVIDTPFIPAKKAYEEEILIQRYVPYTYEELLEIKKQKTLPSLEERICAIEDLLLSETMGKKS